ncbi:cyclin-L1-like [Dysidea avara]|uniref:cyclin-L1-like n=1 Tax=Dysidea avara TaxID=196820 RepID=UPI00332979A2
MEPPQEYSRIEIALENRVIPEEKLENTPSRKHGISEELERDLRVVGCEYIQCAGLLLRLPQVAMATAQVLFQRFYYSKSFVNYSVQYMAAACIFVAAKVEEAPRRLRDVINVFHHLRQKWMGRPIQPMEYLGNTYFKVKSEIIQCEKYLLKTLGLCVHVQHPHKLIITFLQVLEMEENVELVQCVWNYMNDSLRTNVFVRFSPDKIACACIFLAAREFKIPLPSNPSWWLMFEVSKRDIETIALEILQLYTYPSRSLEELEKEVSKIKEELSKKKQVEIKEVQLNSVLTSRNGSPNKDSPLIVVSDEKKSSQSGSELKSPAIVVNKKLSDRNSDKLNNHTSPKRAKKRRRSNSLEPRLKRKRSRSPGSNPSQSTSDEHSRHSDAAYKPINSPIKLSGSSAPEESGTGTPVEDNKVPRKYQNKYDNHKHKKHRSHRHERHHKREKHQKREQGRSRNRYDSRPEHRRSDSKRRQHVPHRRRNDGHVYK